MDFGLDFCVICGGVLGENWWDLGGDLRNYFLYYFIGFQVSVQDNLVTANAQKRQYSSVLSTPATLLG